MAHSEICEKFAKRIGFYAFNRYAAKKGLTLEQTLCIIRNVF